RSSCFRNVSCGRWPGNPPDLFAPTTCNANVFCDGSLSFACGVCVWRFSLCVFSLENPYRGKLSCRRSESERKHCFGRMANGFVKEAPHPFSGTCIAILQAGMHEIGKRAGVKAGAIHPLTRTCNRAGGI